MMGATLRFIKAILYAAISYGLYIYFPQYLFDFLETYTEFGNVVISLGDIAQLEIYIRSFGFMIVGLSFASAMAPKKTTIKAVWELLRLFFGIVFWAMFIAAEFNTIFITAVLPPSIGLALNLDITIMFYCTMGGKIFRIIIVILDFFIAMTSKDEDNEKDKDKNKNSPQNTDNSTESFSNYLESPVPQNVRR